MMNYSEMSDQELLGVFLFLTVVDLKDLSKETFREVLEVLADRPSVKLDSKFKRRSPTARTAAEESVILSNFLYRAYRVNKELSTRQKEIDEAFNDGHSILSLVFSKS